MNESRHVNAVCPHCLQSGSVTSWQRGGMWCVQVDRVQGRVVLRDGTVADGLLECSTEPCIASQGRMQSRPLRAEDVVQASLREVLAQK